MTEGSATTRTKPVTVSVGEADLEGDLSMQEEIGALILFAHGSGSSRQSPRNRFVADALHRRRMGTLLVDLLTPAEQERDRARLELRFDIQLLAERLVRILDWCAGTEELRTLPIGIFGASTGAAAALIAAAARPERVGAIISRGGRPDLALGALPGVRAPTLLIVGERDTPVIQMNREAQVRLGAESRLEIVPNATHLFEEPGALEEVAELTRRWFARHLARHCER